MSDHAEPFLPHAIILTERKRPEPIFVAAIIGVDRILRIDFDLSVPQASFVAQALAGLRARVRSWNRNADPAMLLESYQLPAFGRPKGFVINYDTVRAVRFDLTGKAQALLPKAHCIGRAKIELPSDA
jgi:hypothetical protein